MRERERFMMCAAAVASLAIAATATAGDAIIDFDSFAPEDPFTGGVEDGFRIGNIVGPVAVDGNFNLGPFSGPNSIHHGTLGDAEFTITNEAGDPFILDNFWAGSDFGGADPLVVTGYLNGVEVGSDTFDANPPGAYFNFTPTNLAGVVLDEIVFDLGGAPLGPTHVDDIHFQIVPAPGAFALLGLGLGVMRTRRRSS